MLLIKWDRPMKEVLGGRQVTERNSYDMDRHFSGARPTIVPDLDEVVHPIPPVGPKRHKFPHSRSMKRQSGELRFARSRCLLQLIEWRGIRSQCSSGCPL